MPAKKDSAGTTFRVFFKIHRSIPGGEASIPDNFPWSVQSGKSVLSGIMLNQALS
jgi:hypothetical protein